MVIPHLSTPQRGLHLFLGPDRAGKRARIGGLIETLRVSPFDRHETVAGELPAAGLAGLIRQHPASGSSTLIVIDDAHKLDAASVEALAQSAESMKSLTCVILLVDVELPATHCLMTIKARATVECFERPIDAHASAFGQTAFGLVEAVARRDAGAALQVIHEQLARGKDVIEFVGLLVWQLQRWLTIRHLLDAGHAADRISAATKIQPWQVGRITAEVRGRSAEWLRHMVRRCEDVDRGAKSGRLIPRVALEQLVIELCQERGRATSSKSPAGRG